MDILDVSRLLARRWPVSVPLLLLTAAATLVAAFNVRPDYVGTTYVSLLPPTAQRSAAPGQTLRVNPWDNETLASAVVVRLNTRSVADQIEAEGVERVWRVGLDEQSRSIVRIEVTSPTRAQARSALARLLREVDDEVNRQQARYSNLAPEDKITAVRLDSAGDVEPATEKVERAVVVVAVAGLLLTTAATVGVDAAHRRRTRRRSGAAGHRRNPSAAGSRPVFRHAGDLPATSTDTDATQPVVITNVPLQTPVAGVTLATLADNGRYPSIERASLTGGGATGPDDSTIVLPLSNAPWAERQRQVTAGGAAGQNGETADGGQG